jgi:DNA-binding response OmpR family regulator
VTSQGGQIGNGRSQTGPVGRLLVVDDDNDVRSLLTRLLRAEGYEVEEAATGSAAVEAVTKRPPDLMILDLMLNGEDGLDVLAAVRRAGDVPVICVTGRSGETERVLGLRLGADDYIAKPFSGAELTARVASVLRRTGRRSTAASTGSTIRAGDLTIDVRSREVRLRGELIETTAKEFDLLAFLASSPRQVFTREQLLDQVWDSSSAWQDAGTVTEHIRRIRRKLEQDPEQPQRIRTVRGVGYRFEP